MNCFVSSFIFAKFLKEILSRQQAEVEGLLNRLATQLKTKKERLVFQINNYDVVLSILNVWVYLNFIFAKLGQIQEKIVNESKERGSFWELQQTKMGTYVEEVLSPHFLPLIQFVNECEPLVEQNHSQLLARYTGSLSILYTLSNILKLLFKRKLFKLCVHSVRSGAVRWKQLTMKSFAHLLTSKMAQTFCRCRF